jgi:hypothetical protein
MDRKEYINCRSANQFPPILFYEYYMNNINEKSYKFSSLDEFIHVFQTFMPFSQMYGFNLEMILAYFDQKHIVGKIIKDEKTIKYY